MLSLWHQQLTEGSEDSKWQVKKRQKYWWCWWMLPKRWQLVLAQLLLSEPRGPVGWLMCALPTSVTGQLWHFGLRSRPELKHPSILDAKSDEVRYSMCVCVCVGGWHKIKITHSLPVAKQTECNVCEMTFALPEEFSVSLSYGFAFRVAWGKKSEERVR